MTSVLASQGLTLLENLRVAGLVSVAKLTNECLNKVFAPAASPSHKGQASDQPNMAGGDVSDDAACSSDFIASLTRPRCVP